MTTNRQTDRHTDRQTLVCHVWSNEIAHYVMENQSDRFVCVCATPPSAITHGAKKDNATEEGSDRLLDKGSIAVAGTAIGKRRIAICGSALLGSLRNGDSPRKTAPKGTRNWLLQNLAHHPGMEDETEVDSLHIDTTLQFRSRCNMVL